MTNINPTLLIQQGAIQNATSKAANSNDNPYNLINIATAQEVGDIAKKEIGTAGYSAPPAGYEEATKAFLKALDGELGTRNTAFVTSPTADKGSIDAITSEITGLNKGKIFYTTAQDYVDYINPKNFPTSIDSVAYSKLPKHVLPTGAEYSKATAEASNVFVATGGRNATVSDFVNALKKGNKAVVLNNPAIETPAWGEAKNRVENASRYLLDQIEAFKAEKPLPYPEVGEFTANFMADNKEKIDSLVKIITFEDKDPKSVLTAAKEAAQFIR